MAQTDYLGLPLTSDSDDQMTFLDWRRRIDGPGNSDMVMIDAAIKSHHDSVVSDENGSHGIRNINGVLQYLDEDGGWTDATIQHLGASIWYGTTTTLASENPKVVTTTTGDFRLKKGARIGVKFIYGNIGSQHLNIDGTGTVKIVSSNDENGTYNTDVPVTYKSTGQIIWFTYDGEYFVADDSVRATEDTVGKVTISDKVNKTSSTTAASSTAVKAAYDKAMEAYNKSTHGVSSFNARIGDIVPASGDYTADMVGADKEGAAAAVQTNLDAHSGDTDMHVTASRKNTWDGKQDKLTFDSEPTSGSSNPVTSGGVFSFVATAIEGAIGAALGGSY